jgi:hypothetical protein
MAGLNDEQYAEVKEAIGAIDKLTIAFSQLKGAYGDLKDGVKQINDLAIAFAGLQTAILGNGTKGLRDRMSEVEEDIKTIKNAKEKAPRFSWKQLLIIIPTVLLVAGFMTGFITVRIEDQARKYDAQSLQITKLSDMFYQHIIPNH